MMSKSMFDVHVKPFMEAIFYVRASKKLRPFCCISLPVWLKFDRFIELIEFSKIRNSESHAVRRKDIIESLCVFSTFLIQF